MKTAEPRLTHSTLPAATATPEPSSDVVIMGLPFWNVCSEQFTEWWKSEVGKPAQRPRIVLFANAHTLTLTRLNPSLRVAMQSADVIANDGVGVRIATRMRGDRIKENLNGTDLIPKLLNSLGERQRVFLYGGTEEINAIAAMKLAMRYPNINVCGRIHGFVDRGEAAAAINEAKPDLVLVGLGHPYQELFCAKHRDDLACSMLMSCGAFFDFVSGAKPRSPEWMRRTSLEWLHRLLIEPKRMWKRYLVGIPVFLLLSASSILPDRRMARKLRPSDTDVAPKPDSNDPRRLVSQSQES